MVLPVWAHKRNKLYDRIVFQDCRENSLGWHESISSTEPYYCRPLTPAENSVDAVTCPTTRFSTDKGIPVSHVQIGAGGGMSECNQAFIDSFHNNTKSLY